MPYLFSRWEAVSRGLRLAPHRLLLFDFDGTLAPIVVHGSLARIPGASKRWLKQLSRRTGNRVGILSGRALGQLRKKVGLPGLIYGGSHGLEIQEGRRRWVCPEAARKSGRLRKIRLAIKSVVTGIPGVWIEDKGLTMGVHYRQAPLSKVPRIQKKVRKAMASIPGSGAFEILQGKKVMDILPKGLGKGEAVKVLLKKSPKGTAVLYTGDDTTDQTAFRALGSRGITVRVGRRRGSASRYFLKNQGEVARLLERLVTL